jgi:AraC-like DNA-binding protein
VIKKFYQREHNALLLLVKEESNFHKGYHTEDYKDLYTFVWNNGPKQEVVIDQIVYQFEAGNFLPIMMDQSFSFEKPEQIVAWQFNREFYCIVNHDIEVGCVGFLFYGFPPNLFIQLDEIQLLEMQNFLHLFEQEFDTDDDIKNEMLRSFLVNLIIKLTRLAKKQYVKDEVSSSQFYIVRHFNLNVELYFKKEHQVQFYAALLNKSPKTISNIFAKYSDKKPIEVIHDRIIIEAKRLFFYTDKTIKEIAAELGFEDQAHFSKFFKQYTKQSPSDFKKNR